MDAKQDLSVTSSNTDFSSLFIFFFPSLSGCLQPVDQQCAENEELNEYLVHGVQLGHTMFFSLKLDNSMISDSMGHSSIFCEKLCLSCYMLCKWFAGQLAHAASEPTVLSCAAWHGRCCWVLPSGSDLSLRTQLGTYKYFFTLRQFLLEKMDSVQIHVKHFVASLYPSFSVHLPCWNNFQAHFTASSISHFE